MKNYWTAALILLVGNFLSAEYSIAAHSLAEHCECSDSVLTPNQSIDFERTTSWQTRGDIDSIHFIAPERLVVASEQTDINREGEQLGAERDVFFQIFGATQKPQSVVVPWFADGTLRGETRVFVDNGRLLSIEVAPILDGIDLILQSKSRKRLNQAEDQYGFVSTGVFIEAGLITNFDSNRLELTIVIPANSRETAALDLRELPTSINRSLPPGETSGYLNLRAAQDIEWSDQPGQAEGRQALLLNFETILRVGDWVLEGGYDWLEGRDQSLIREDFRLIRDDSDQAIRYTLGDFSTPLTGFFQQGQSQGGIMISRNYALQPYRNVRPTGEYNLFLERPSTVDLVVNGLTVKQLQFNPGPLDIRNLPLSSGINDVELIVTDDLGQVQRFQYSPSVAGGQLATGVHQFSYHFGYPYEITNNSRNYDQDNPHFSASHRLGITDNFTFLDYIQIAERHVLTGAGGVLATKKGNLGWELALSRDEDLGSDQATRLQYEWLGKGSGKKTTFRTALEYRGSNFTTARENEPSDFGSDVSIFYNPNLVRNSNLNLNLRYQIGRDVPNVLTTTIDTSYALGRGLTGSLNLRSFREEGESSDLSAIIQFYWSDPSKKRTMLLNARRPDSGNTTTQFSLNQEPEESLRSWGGSIDLIDNSDGYDLSGRLGYADNRFEAGITQDLVYDSDLGELQKNRTRLTYGSALAFVDGKAAWARPINDSFVMVEPHKDWREYEILVKSATGKTIAVVDEWGPGVLPALQSYFVSEIKLDSTRAPLGFSLGKQKYTLLPTYRSGTLIQAGDDKVVTVRGVLVGESGRPIALATGRVSSASDPEWVNQMMFTNRTGRFVVPGIRPGDYQIDVKGYSMVSFSIPEDAVGLYDIDIISVK